MLTRTLCLSGTINNDITAVHVYGASVADLEKRVSGFAKSIGWRPNKQTKNVTTSYYRQTTFPIATLLIPHILWRQKLVTQLQKGACHYLWEIFYFNASSTKISRNWRVSKTSETSLNSPLLIIFAARCKHYLNGCHSKDATKTNCYILPPF